MKVSRCIDGLAMLLLSYPTLGQLYPPKEYVGSVTY